MFLLDYLQELSEDATGADIYHDLQELREDTYGADTALLAVARVGGNIEVRQAVSGEEVGRIASTSGREDTDATIKGLHLLWKAPVLAPDR